MSQKNINELLENSLKNLDLIIDSSKVVGKPIYINETKFIIPICRITYGFGVGGSEFNTKNASIINNDLIDIDKYPFGGGSLCGVNVYPIAFLIIDEVSYNLIKIEQESSIFEKILELVSSYLKSKHKKNKD